ncbi:shikimate dehydrogenase [Endothiovibrio diazotrophicus]
MTDRYAVMGNPIAHSKSPAIHARFAAQTAQDLEYRAILVEEGGFPAAVAAFRAEGGRGLNVTVPFKQQAWTAAERRSPRAERAGAVNTLRFDDDGTLYGDNTDGIGLVRDLTHNHGVALEGRRVLILGAGGAVRGVLQPILEHRPAQLVVANRTAVRAEELARLFADAGEVAGGGFDLAAEPFDVVINGTAASLQGEVPPIASALLARGCFCYDMMYAAEPTAFLRWAMGHGVVRAVDGLGMLVEQAAESFHLWRGVRPDTAPVIEALREAMK